MARYYCEYCHSYLTHDTLSVRNSHLIGKNHLRVVANYYRNKARSEKWPLATSTSCTLVPSPDEPGMSIIRIKPSKRSTKKQARQKARLLQKEQNALSKETIDVLSTLYRGSPGYSKVFVPTNRLDIGASVKQSRRPQRANEKDNQSTTIPRNETIDEATLAAANTPMLPPPRLLTMWAHPLPKSATPYSNNERSNKK